MADSAKTPTPAERKDASNQSSIHHCPPSEAILLISLNRGESDPRCPSNLSADLKPLTLRGGRRRLDNFLLAPHTSEVAKKASIWTCCFVPGIRSE